MDPVKRQTIISEIERWRTSKLLPEHYCDFLLNLYIEEQDVSKGKIRHSTSNGKLLIIGRSFLILSAISLILVCSLYFTSFHPAMQILFSITLIGILYGYGIVNRDRKPNISFINIGGASILLLFISEFILRINEWNHAPTVMAIIALCGAIWVLIGIIARVVLLHASGWICLIMAYTWLVQSIHPDPNSYIFQFYMIPIFVILYIIGRSLTSSSWGTGLLFMIVSSLFFLIPEVYGLLFSNSSKYTLLIVLICKILIVAFMIWLALRKPKLKEMVTDNES